MCTAGENDIEAQIQVWFRLCQCLSMCCRLSIAAAQSGRIRDDLASALLDMDVLNGDASADVELERKSSPVPGSQLVCVLPSCFFVV